MTPCVFCDILAGKLPSSIVYQDYRCSAFLDIQPINPGHILVIPNTHAASLAELDENIGADLFRMARQVATALKESGVKCEGVNIFLADGAAAGQEVFHVHLHVVPRYKGDGFGFKFPPGYSDKPERSELNAIALQISNAI